MHFRESQIIISNSIEFEIDDEILFDGDCDVETEISFGIGGNNSTSSIINELLSDILGETLEDILLEDDILIVGEGVFDLEIVLLLENERELVIDKLSDFVFEMELVFVLLEDFVVEELDEVETEKLWEDVGDIDEDKVVDEVVDRSEVPEIDLVTDTLTELDGDTDGVAERKGWVLLHNIPSNAHSSVVQRICQEG